ncbi:FecR domain-containing protein, partial [Chitinophaga sp.]|uniref:FecR domain-containing protein n=1 Tax=Chitinophaga sp. TaxID=1869181 RepID=UPI002F94F23E
MSTSEFKNIVERYLKGEASAVDQAMIEAWMAATEDNPVDLTEAELKAIRADMLQHLREHNGYLLETGGGGVLTPEEDADLQISEEHTTVPVVRRLLPWIRRIAVAVIFCIGVLSLFYYWRTTTVKPAQVVANETLAAPQYRVRVIAANAIRKVVLPDSSVVMLNRSGSLYYNMPFDKSTREVFLDEGEAFFEVKKNSRY